MWLKLYVLNNCFNDKTKTHLGLKYKGQWYCITHFNNYVGVLIPKYRLKMKIKSTKNEYLKKLTNSAPNIMNETPMRIHSNVLKNYEVNKLDSLENKRKRYNEHTNK